MNIQIIVKNVEVNHVSKGKSNYDVAEVTYSDKGQTKHQKVFSFKNPQLFASVKDMKADQTYDVTITKEGNFWEWTAVKAASAGGTTASMARPGGTYETAEERASRQALIVRQSCLAQAIASAKTDSEVLDVDFIFQRAEQFVDWVMQSEEAELPFPV